MSEGFYKRRRGILEHIEAGKIDLLESGIHDYLSLKANLLIGSPCSIPVGVVFTSAPAIHPYYRRVSERTIQRCLEHLQSIGWLKLFNTQGRRGNYPVLVCRASVHDVSGNEYRINGVKTTDWRKPVFEPVGEESVSCPDSVGGVSGYRELREESREKKERKAGKLRPPADSRYGPFLEAAKAAYTLKHSEPPTWDCFGKDGSALARFLRRAPHITAGEWQLRLSHYFDSTEPFTVKQGGSLSYFVSKFDTFANGPILEKPVGGTHGSTKKLTGNDLTAANLKAAGFVQ